MLLVNTPRIKKLPSGTSGLSEVGPNSKTASSVPSPVLLGAIARSSFETPCPQV